MAMELSEWDSQEFPWQQVDKNYFKISGESPFYQLTVGQNYEDFDYQDYFSENRKPKMMLQVSIFCRQM